MKKVFSSVSLVLVLFMSGCVNRKNSAEVMRTSSFVQQQLIESNEPQGPIKSSATTETYSVVPEDTIKNVATAILNMPDFTFAQDIIQNLDSRVADVERIFIISAEADYLHNSLKKICENPIATLFDEQDNYETAIEVSHNLALGKIGYVSKSINNFSFSLLEAREVARDAIVSTWNAVRSHDEQVRDIAKIQRDVQSTLQDLEDIKSYVNGGNLEYKRSQQVLNDANTILNTAYKGNRAQNLVMFNRLLQSRNYGQRIDIDSISTDLINALLRSDPNNVTNQLDSIINDQNLKNFAISINQFAQLLNN
ncbi:MAG: hypothetical protein LBD17_02640 [Endomicrobium sp.]|jgi:hypothetical protein|nr:hypothetical protein [Endomicrobium sp.]